MTEMALRSRMAVLVVVALLSVYPVRVWTGGAGHSETTRSARRPGAVSGSSPAASSASSLATGRRRLRHWERPTERSAVRCTMPLGLPSGLRKPRGTRSR